MMKAYKCLTAVGSVALMLLVLLAAPVALAHGGGSKDNGRSEVRAHAWGQFKGWFSGKSDWRDKWRVRWQERVEALGGTAALGTVTSVSDSRIVMDPVGTDTRTTVTINGDTVIKAKGEVIDQDELEEGQRLLVVGTTTATSGDGDSIAANLVVVVGKWFGHIGAWLGLK